MCCHQKDTPYLGKICKPSSNIENTINIQYATAVNTVDVNNFSLSFVCLEKLQLSLGATLEEKIKMETRTYKRGGQYEGAMTHCGPE